MATVNTVNIRVVGIFFRRDYTDLGVDVPGDVTVRDVMQAVRDRESNFDYVDDAEFFGSSSFTARTATLLNASYLLTSDEVQTRLSAGEPRITEAVGRLSLLNPNVDRTLRLAEPIDARFRYELPSFQYYINRPVNAGEFDPVTRPGRNDAFKPFGDSEPVLDGDTIIWRQVSIAKDYDSVGGSRQLLRIAAQAAMLEERGEMENLRSKMG
ncbi:MAG: hypothetical protein AAF532_03990 [Planctomycetota bacterium]